MCDRVKREQEKKMMMLLTLVMMKEKILPFKEHAYAQTQTQTHKHASNKQTNQQTKIRAIDRLSLSPDINTQTDTRKRSHIIEMKIHLFLLTLTA